jgi:hypothetical protein
MSDYMTEFPDYDDTLILPKGWQDVSWKNDACPSFERKYGNVAYRIFCDYENLDRREIQHDPRFILYIEDEVNYECIGQFHTLDDTLKFIEKEIAA